MCANLDAVRSIYANWEAGDLNHGAEMGPKVAALFHVRHDKLTRLVAYFDRDRALADLRPEG